MDATRSDPVVPVSLVASVRTSTTSRLAQKKGCLQYNNINVLYRSLRCIARRLVSCSRSCRVVGLGVDSTE